MRRTRSFQTALPVSCRLRYRALKSREYLVHRLLAMSLAGTACLSTPSSAAGFGGLLGFGQETIYCKFHGGEKFRALTTYGLERPETRSTQTTLRLLAEMAASKKITHFRIDKSKCGTLFINRAIRSRQCLLIASAAAAGASTRFDNPMPGEAFATLEVLSVTLGSTLPLPQTSGLIGSQSDCRVSDVGTLTIKG